MVFEEKEVDLSTLPKVKTDIMLNLASPHEALRFWQLPVKGVGLARMEFILNDQIKIHPMALVHPERVEDEKVRERIKKMTAGYKQPQEFFVEKLAQGIAVIAAAFHPRPVIVRLSDFKTNEYRQLLGGSAFEPIEENPMLGFRGAARYVHPLYREAFALECAAIKRVREQMGLKNVIVMVPFVRTVGEAEQVVKTVAANGLVQGEDELMLYMMCEIPSNVILMDAFSKIFDGFSIGSNDLTQLTLGVDRDSQLLAGAFDERDPAVQEMLRRAIEGASANGKPIGLCGQAPSDHFELGQQLIDWGITSLSLNSDAVIPFLQRFK